LELQVARATTQLMHRHNGRSLAARICSGTHALLAKALREWIGEIAAVFELEHIPRTLLKRRVADPDAPRRIRPCGAGDVLQSTGLIKPVAPPPDELFPQVGSRE
jgi:hypothetical protein